MKSEVLYCMECGHDIISSEVVMCEHHAFCSMKCYGSCVGFVYFDNSGYVDKDDLLEIEE